VRLLLNTDTEGRVSLGELRPGFALHLSVIDDTGLVLHEQEIAPLRPAERRVVSVHLDAAPRELSGRVVSGSGAPIPGAGVSLGAIGGEESRREGTGNDGRFHFHRVAEREFRLAVAKDGFLPLVREPVRPGAELELVLERVPDVTVRVFAASGRPFPGGTVRARHTDDEQREPYADDGVTAEPIADGLFELRVRRSKPAGCRE
jgi:hypothetical protein